MKIFLLFLYVILFGVLIFPETQKVSETILWVNLFTLLPTLIFINWEEHVIPRIMPFKFVRAVFIQAIMQMIIYLYWGKYNPAVIDRLPLLIHQIAFGYIVQFNLCMFSGKKCSVSFSTMAAIVSANLFIWFAHKIYFFHYILISSALILKMLLTKKVNEVERHIFNPSALVSFIAVIAILLYKVPSAFSEFFYGPQIGAFWLWLPHFDLVVLICSVITLWTPNLYIIPLSSVSFFILGDFFTRFFLDSDLIEESGRGAVFLGITFLITDPSTAPKTRIGQILYGISYSISVCLGFSILSALHSHLYFKKVLFIVIIYLLIPYFDQIGIFSGKIFQRFSNWLENLTRLKWLLIYVTFFFLFFNYFERGTKPPYFFDFSGNLSGQQLPLEMQMHLKQYFENHPRSEFWKDIKPGFGFGPRFFKGKGSNMKRRMVMEKNYVILLLMDVRIRITSFIRGFFDEFNYMEKCDKYKKKLLSPGEYINPLRCSPPRSPFEKNPDFERY